MTRERLLAAGFIIALLLMLNFLFTGEKYKGEIKQIEKKVELLQQRGKNLDMVTDSLKTYSLTMQATVKTLNNELVSKDSTIQGMKKGGRKKVAEVKSYTPTEADDIIIQRYPNEETRSRDILTDLTEGENALELNPLLEDKIVTLEKKVAVLDGVITAKDMIVINLEKKIDLKDEMLSFREEQLKLSRKEIKKQKREKIFAIIGGSVAVVLSLLSK